MDPEAEEHYIGLLEQWKKDEDNVKDLLEGIGSDMSNVMRTTFQPLQFGVIISN